MTGGVQINTPQLLLRAGAGIMPLGVLVALLVSPVTGGVLVLLGYVLGLLGLHRFGRLGAERFDSKRLGPGPVHH